MLPDVVRIVSDRDAPRPVKTDLTTNLLAPDVVADARGEDVMERAASRHDRLKRSRLPSEMYFMALEWREHPVELTKRIVIANASVCASLMMSLSVIACCIGPIVSYFGRWLFCEWTYQIICFVSGYFAFKAFEL